jgi:hypothetical protein
VERAIVAGLAVLVLARAILTLVPSMTWWGLNVQRFLDPAIAWGTWLVLAALLVPKVGRAVAPALESVGRAIQSRTVFVCAVIAAMAGGLVFAFPDRVFYVGDFLIRLGGLREGEDPRVLSPQAFPLDVWAHFTLPLQIQTATGMDVLTAVRLVGAVAAAALGGGAVLFARALRLPSAASVTALATVLFGGYLCLFTGESKAFGEMCVIVVAFAACALNAVDVSAPATQRARGAGNAIALFGAGLCLGLGILFHRFALGLIPAFVTTAILWSNARKAAGVRTSPRERVLTLAAFAAPALVLAVMGPRTWTTVVTYDLGANFATAEARAGGIVAAALSPPRLRDVLNLILFLAPAVPIAALTLVRRRPRASGDPDVTRRRDQGRIATAVALPFVFVFVFARPPQGLVRDWDSFATAGAALAVWAAVRLGASLGPMGRPALAVALVAAVAVPSVQWLAHFADEARALARIEALMVGPPQRPLEDRARSWDFLGWRHFHGARYDAAARAFEQAVTAAPSARNHTHWAMAETMLGRHAQALEIYTRAAERDSNLAIAWFGVGVSGINSGHRPEVERALRHLERVAPDNEKTREIRQWLEANP